jgi:hypothetical protein
MILRRGRGTPATIFTHLRFHKAELVVSSPLLSRRARPSGILRAQLIARPYSSTPGASKKDDSNTFLDPAHPGTAPERSAYLVLHTSTPSASWPAVHSKASPLVKSLLLRLKPFHGIVNISHDPRLRSPSDEYNYAFPSATEAVNEAYPATLYRSGGLSPVFVPRLSSENIDSLIPLLEENSALASTNPPNNSQSIENVHISSVAPHGSASGGVHSRLARHLYVCTHNARDCRCGTVGLEVFTALSRLCALSISSSALPRVQEIGHVGGHNYAANILDFPNGDMYGGVWLSNVEAFARALLASDAPFGVDEGSSNRSEEDSKLLTGFWRGRLGMSAAEQESFHAALVARLESRPQVSEPSMMSQMSPRAPSSLIPLVFETHDGKSISIDAEEGKSVMEVAKLADIPSIEGTCGGKLEVCHIFLLADRLEGLISTLFSVQRVMYTLLRSHQL